MNLRLMFGTVARRGMIGALLVAMSAPASATLMVDFSRGDSTPLQSGFLGFNLTVDGAVVNQTGTFTSVDEQADTNGVNATISGASLFTRDYAAITAGTYVSQSNLLSDWVGLSNSTGSMSLTLGNLQTGIYNIKLYSHTTLASGETFDVLLTDSLVTNSIQVAGATTSVGTAPSTITEGIISFTIADVADSAIVTFDAVSGSGIMALNGFELTKVGTLSSGGSVPLPPQFALMLIGALTLRMWSSHRRGAG